MPKAALVNLTGNGSIMIPKEHDSIIITRVFLLSLEGVPKWVYSGRLFVVSARTNKRSSSSALSGPSVSASESPLPTSRISSRSGSRDVQQACCTLSVQRELQA